MTPWFTDRPIFGQVKLPRTENRVHWSESIDKTLRFVRSCQQGRYSVTEDYSRLDMCAQSEAPETVGESLLHYFCRCGHLEAVKFVIKYGAVIDDSQDDGKTPLTVATLQGQAGIVRYLLEDHNANVEARDVWGNTVLHHASRKGHLAIVRLLVARCAELIRTFNWLRQSPRDAAIENNHGCVVSYFDGVLVSTTQNDT